MQNKSMVYISYVDIDNAVSGSKVRPKQMLKWFRAKGVEVQELVGEQTTNTLRTNAYETYNKKYNAEKNYEDFFSRLRSILR